MYSIAWLVAFIVLLFVELLMSDSLSFWFVIGTLSALITSLYTNSVILQFLVFGIASIISFFILSFIMNLDNDVVVKRTVVKSKEE